MSKAAKQKTNHPQLALISTNTKNNDHLKNRVEQNLKSKKLTQWLVKEWNAMNKILMNPDQDVIASYAKCIQNSLWQLAQLDLDDTSNHTNSLHENLTVVGNIETVEITVSINIQNWKLWTMLLDQETELIVATEDRKEFVLC